MGWGVDSAFVFVWMALQVGVRGICGVGAGQSKMVGGGGGRQRLGPVGGAVQVASAALAAGTPVGDGGDTGGIARRESRDGRRLWRWVLGVGLYRGSRTSCHVPAWLSLVLYSRMGVRTHACLCSLMLWMGWHPDLVVSFRGRCRGRGCTVRLLVVFLPSSGHYVCTHSYPIRPSPSPLQPRQILEIKSFLVTARRKDAQSVKIKKSSTSTKFKVRCSKYMYTLVVTDQVKAKKLESSLPPGTCRDARDVGGGHRGAGVFALVMPRMVDR